MELVHGILLEHVYGILLDEKFLYRSVHAAFVITKWYEAWLERTLLLDPIIFDMWIPGVLSWAPGSLVTAITQDTLVKTQSLFCICVVVLSSITSRSVAASGARSLMRFSLVSAAAATRRILGWSPRSSLMLIVSHATALCASRRVSSLLVVPAEYRHG